MKKNKFYLLFLFVFTVNAAFCQAKFQNNRFSNIEAVPVTIYTTDDFYMVFGDFTEEVDAQLSKVFTPDDYQYIKWMNEEENSPEALKTLELQLQNYDKFTKAKAYKIAEFQYDNIATVILCVPVSENARLKKEGMIDDKDLILVGQKRDIEKPK
ncbi:MAG: hypothetical protein IPH20_22120 [Bacteroidales bacterium]|nr:hypothetical protein [Bacteroidales bacterium]